MDCHELVADCRRRQLPSLSFDDIVQSSRRLFLGAELTTGATVLGLASDEAIMTSEDLWPKDINESLKRLGLFDKYSPTTLHGVIAHLNAQQQMGLESTVKGTDFEMQSVAKIRHHDIPLQGVHHVQLATALNQPGWDAVASGPHIAPEYLQMKATSSQEVLTHHLARYPQYPDIVTTHGVAQQAISHNIDPGHIIDSGISNAQLTDHIDASLSNLDLAHVVHEFVPEISLAVIVIGAAIRLRKGQSRREVKTWAKEQAAIAGIANMAGLIAQLIFGGPLMRIPVSIGTRMAAYRGKFSTRIVDRLAHHRAHLQILKDSCQQTLA